MRVPFGLCVIGTMKLATAAALALIGLGILRHLDSDTRDWVVKLVFRLHLNPESHLIAMGLAWLEGVGPTHLRFIGQGTLLYALLYVVEGVGLLMRKHWAEYLVIIATSLLLPVEIYELLYKASLLKVAVLGINLAIVLYLIRQLRRA
jgi:uncharacterized membrane protein (DUF2068 family)